MLLNTKTNHKVPERGNIKRFGEMLAIKQDASTIELNRVFLEPDKETWNQQKISLLEQKETIDAPLLQQISAALKIPMKAKQNFEREQAVNIIADTFDDNACVGNVNATFNFNPIGELKKLHEEKIALYERMIKEKDEMMGRLERLSEKK